MNVVYFPVACRIKGRIWYAGQSFESERELIDSLSEKDWRWRRVVEWELGAVEPKRAATNNTGAPHDPRPLR